MRIVGRMLLRVSSEETGVVLGVKGQHWHGCRNREVRRKQKAPVYDAAFHPLAVVCNAV